MQKNNLQILSVRFIFFTVVLAGCAAGQASTSASPSSVPSLIPYQTITPAETQEIEGTNVFNLPSPTPFIYTVVANDTLFTIAARLNISLDALIAANPDVDARALTPGTELLIPVEGQIASVTAQPTVTPVPAPLGAPKCYSTAVGELWCFVLVINDGDQTLENVSAFVQLVAVNGEVLANVEAVPPLDVVSVGTQMPLVAYLKEAPQEWIISRSQLLTAYWLPENDVHYLDVEAINFELTPAASSKQAMRVAGRVDLSGGATAASLWVLAVAYDSSGQVVGVRRWESDGAVDFNFWVYSLGPDIADVQVLAEARP